MNQNNVLKTLKSLIDEPKTLEELKIWYLDNYPDSNFYKFMVKILKYQLVYIPKFGKSEKPPFDILVSDDIKTITNFMFLGNKLLNKFINNLLVNHLANDNEEIETIEEKLEKLIPNE